MLASWPLVAGGSTPPRVPDSRLTPVNMFLFAAHFLFSLLLLFAFIEGVLCAGTVLGNKALSYPRPQRMEPSGLAEE